MFSFPLYTKNPKKSLHGTPPLHLSRVIHINHYRFTFTKKMTIDPHCQYVHLSSMYYFSRCGHSVLILKHKASLPIPEITFAQFAQCVFTNVALTENIVIHNFWEKYFQRSQRQCWYPCWPPCSSLAGTCLARRTALSSRRVSVHHHHHHHHHHLQEGACPLEENNIIGNSGGAANAAECQVTDNCL